MNWRKIETRIAELEDKQSDLETDYNSTVELIEEALEEKDLATFKKYSADAIELLQELDDISYELSLLGNYIENAVDDMRCR